MGLEPTVSADTCVVDEQIQAAPEFFNVGKERGSRFGFSDIASKRDHGIGSQFVKLLGKLFELLLATGNEHESRSVLGKLQGEMAADTRRCPGEKDVSAFQKTRVRFDKGIKIGRESFVCGLVGGVGEGLILCHGAFGKCVRACRVVVDAKVC